LQIDDIEVMDLGNRSNRLQLNRLSVLNASSTSNTLRIAGGASDAVSIAGLWFISTLSSITIGSEQYYQFFTDQATLQIDKDINFTITDSLMPLFSNSHGGDNVDFAVLTPIFFDPATLYDAKGGGDVVVLPDASVALLWAYDPANVFFGGLGDDQITGGDLNDIIEGGAGMDILTGGPGVDTLSYANSPAGVTVTLGSGIGVGGDAQGDSNSNFENLIGSAFADILTGDAGANEIFGGAGDDTVEGKAGADTLDGGAGINTVSYASSSGVTVDLSLGTGIGGDAQGDIITNFRHLIAQPTV